MLPMLQPEPTLNCGGQTVSGPSTPSASLPPSLTPESDADDIVVSFFDIDVAIQRIESCDLQPGDTWRGMQGKMSVTAPVKKIRKKSDHKPQSQINKSHNEKRRRDLENEAINQLEELLSSCLEAVKQPDKNGIVREATKQIQEVLNRRRECPLECPTRSPGLPVSPLQGGEVSSTQPHSSLHYSELTTLIEALKHYTSSLGLVLLEINCKGEIVCVTENIRDLINLDRNDLYKKSIFSLLHINDHSKIRPLLRSVQSFGWGADSEGLQAVQAKLLLKTSNVPDSAGYVEALIHCAPVRGSGTEAGGSVMCVIRRCEDASAAILPARPRPPHVPDHITFRLDTTFTILSCDLSGVEHCINTNAFFVGKRYLDFVESADRHIALSHLREVACHPVPPAISEPFRLCITADKPWLRVSARSRLFNAKPPTGEPNFIMATHNVLPEDEMLEPNTVNPSVGGPLMPSVANGESSAGGERYRSPISPEESFSMNDFDLEWPSQFALSETMSEDPSDRRDSTSEGPLTPRTPQTPHSEPPPPPQEEPNRLRSLLSKKPSGILTGLLQQPDEEDATSSETSAPHTPHTPHTPAAAMSPLHTPRAPLTPAAPVGPAHSQHSMHQPHDSNSQMLLRILNEKSDEDGDENRRNSQDGRTSQPSALLTQLLSSNGPSSNGRSQDVSDSYLERLGVKRKLPEIPAAAKRATPETQQVSSSAAPAASSSSTTSTSPASSSAGMSPLCQKNQILVSLLARQQQTPLPVSTQIQRAFGPRPRPHQHLPLQHPQGMMQHQPRHMQNIMQHHPRASTVNGGPGLPGVSQASAECSTATSPSYPAHAGSHSHLQMVLQGGPRAPYPPPAPPPHHHQPLHYANTPPHHVYNNQPQSGNTRLPQSGGNELPNDQVLSDILDEVIENMPDSDRAGSDVMMMGMEGNRQLRPDFNAGMKEQNAVINAIRQSLMQCEKQTKSPVTSSPGPGPPPVYSVQSPGPCNIGGSLYTLGNASVQTTVAGAGGAGGATGARGEADSARARAQAEQHRARLLQLQRSQQMLVSPEAADAPQSDLGSTINALVSATPPNVSLSRPDYHNLYHPGPANQIGSNYGSNKITSSQQNPMLSRQLSTSGSGGSSGYAHSGGGAGSPAALHTPMSHAPPPSHPPHSPYHRAPRPMLVGGYYDDGGYCGGEYRRAPPPHHPAHPAVAPHTPHLDAPPPPPSQLNCTGNGSGGGGGATSEFVRNELRAVVGARSSRPDLQQMQPDLDPLMHFDMPTSGGEGAATRARITWPPEQHASTTEVGSAEAAAAAAAGGDETQAAAEAGAGAGATGSGAKASLLQKLLSQ